MSKDRNGRHELRTGQACSVVIAVRENGTSPGMKFLKELMKSDQRAFAKFVSLFDKLCAVGHIRNITQFRKEKGEIWAFKERQYRIGCFHDDGAWVLTHGFIKKQDKWPREQLQRANSIRSEDLSRIENDH